MILDERRFRLLVMAYYRRLRADGLTRIGTRELVGALINTAYDLELFDFQRLLKDQERVRGVITLVGPELANWEDGNKRLAAREALPHLLRAADGYAQLLQEAMYRAMTPQLPDPRQKTGT